MAERRPCCQELTGPPGCSGVPGTVDSLPRRGTTRPQSSDSDAWTGYRIRQARAGVADPSGEREPRSRSTPGGQVPFLTCHSPRSSPVVSCSRRRQIFTRAPWCTDHICSEWLCSSSVRRNYSAAPSPRAAHVDPWGRGCSWRGASSRSSTPMWSCHSCRPSCGSTLHRRGTEGSGPSFRHCG